MVTCTFTVGAAPLSRDAAGEAAAMSMRVMTASRSFCSEVRRSGRTHSLAIVVRMALVAVGLWLLRGLPCEG